MLPKIPFKFLNDCCRISSFFSYFKKLKYSFKKLFNSAVFKFLIKRFKFLSISVKSCFFNASENKENFVHILKELNFKVEFFAISQVDNKFIKNLNHGMGLSTKLFFKKHLLQILKEPLQDKICKKEVSYKCDELVYTFKEENHQIILNITN